MADEKKVVTSTSTGSPSAPTPGKAPSVPPPVRKTTETEEEDRQSAQLEGETESSELSREERGSRYRILHTRVGIWSKDEEVGGSELALSPETLARLLELGAVERI